MNDELRDSLPPPINATDSTYSAGGYIGVRKYNSVDAVSFPSEMGQRQAHYLTDEQKAQLGTEFRQRVTDYDDMQKANATIADIIKYVESKGFRSCVDSLTAMSTRKRLCIFKMVDGRQVYVDWHVSVISLLDGNIWKSRVDRQLQKIEEAIMQGPPEPD